MKRTVAPLLLVLVMHGASAAAVPADADPRVAQLLRLSRAALGGAALDRRTILRIDGTVTQSGLSGTASQWNEIGGKRFAESYVTPPLEGGDGYDGTSVWNRDGSGLVWVDGGEAGRAAEIASAFVGNESLWAPDRGGAVVTWGAARSDKGRDDDTLEITAPGSPVPFVLWFDRSTHLPVRWEQAVGPVTSIAILGDYRPVAGIMIPYAVHVDSNGNSSDLHVTHVEIDPPDGAENLAKPASDVHDFSIAAGRHSTRVPFDLVENHVYLDVMLNGKGPYRFIFDTGGANIVDPQVARDIGAIGTGSVQAGGVGAATESLSFAKVGALQIGAATLKDQLFGVAPVRAGFGVSGGQPVDGLIGFEVLSRFITTFDYGGDVVDLALPATASPPAGADIVPFVFDGRQPQFACTLDGISTQCTLDTGERTSISLFAPFIAAHPQVVPAALSAIGVNGFGFGGPALGKLGRLASVGIGRFTVPDVIGDFTVQTQGAFAAPFIGANVGGGLLRRFAVYLDYANGTMALTPNAAFGESDTYERAGMFLINRDGKKLVADVRAGTAAQTAGIAKGDSITAIDGKPTARLSLDAVRRMFFAPAGTVLRLELTAEDGARRTVTLTLRDFV